MKSKEVHQPPCRPGVTSCHILAPRMSQVQQIRHPYPHPLHTSVSMLHRIFSQDLSCVTLNMAENVFLCALRSLPFPSHNIAFLIIFHSCFIFWLSHTQSVVSLKVILKSSLWLTLLCLAPISSLAHSMKNCVSFFFSISLSLISVSLSLSLSCTHLIPPPKMLLTLLLVSLTRV